METDGRIDVAMDYFDVDKLAKWKGTAFLGGMVSMGARIGSVLFSSKSMDAMASAHDSARRRHLDDL